MADYQTRWNDHSRTQLCPLCGSRFKPYLGGWPMLPGTLIPVCDDCATGADLSTVADKAEIDRRGAMVEAALADISAGRVGDARG